MTNTYEIVENLLYIFPQLNGLSTLDMLKLAQLVNEKELAGLVDDMPDDEEDEEDED